MEIECPPNMIWRKPHTRVSHKGTVSYIQGKCVKPRVRRSPRMSPRSSPRMSPRPCPPGQVWRKPHQKTLRNGVVKQVDGKCVKSRAVKKYASLADILV